MERCRRLLTVLCSERWNVHGYRAVAQVAHAPDQDSMASVTHDILAEMESSGTVKQERVLTGPQGPWIRASPQCQHSHMWVRAQQALSNRLLCWP
jgi:hypothetical protein